MKLHSPPVTWPYCSWTRTCSKTVQPLPPASTGSSPPARPASIAWRRRSAPTFAGSLPPERSRSCSSGWRTSTTNRRALWRSAACARVSSRSTASEPSASGGRRSRRSSRPVPGARADLHAAQPAALAVLEDRGGRELARRAHHAAARVRARAALVVALDRGPVVRPADRRPHEPHLRGEELAREDVALGQADRPLDVERRAHLALEDERPEAGEERLECRLDGVAEARLLGVPVALAQVVRRVLDEAAHDRLARRGHVGIDGRLDRRVDIGPLRVPAVLGIVERPL